MSGPTFTVSVGIGEIVTTRDSGCVLTALALGSCIALCARDPELGVAGMAHVLLPASPQCHSPAETKPAKYADHAVPELIDRLLHQCASSKRLRFWAIGGAFKLTGMAELGALGDRVLRIGELNADAVERCLVERGYALTGRDVGGSVARTARLYVGSGRVTVTTRVAGVAQERELS